MSTMTAARFRLRSFRSQIAIMFGGVVLVLVAALSLFLGDLQAVQIRESAGNSLQVVANNAQRVLAIGLQRRLLVVKSLAETPTLWEHGLDSPEVAAALSQQQLASPNLSWMGVADIDGIVRTATGNLLRGASVSARPWFGAGLEGLHVGDVHEALLLAKLLPPSASGEPQRFVDFAAPIRVGGKTIGVLALHGSWDWTRSVIESQLPEDPKSMAMDLLILNKAGTVIYAPTGDRQTDIKLGDSFPDLVGDGHRNSSIVRWPNGHDYLTSVAALRTKDALTDLGWLIVARLPKDVAYRPVHAAALHVAFYGTIAALIAMMLAWVVAGSISRPLSEIERAAQDVLSGKKGATIPKIGSNVELENLSAALIGMTAGLEQRVMEHTQLARFDPMTKLFNRRGFEEHLAIAVANARRRESSLSVLAIDIDHFKRVNDTYGHDAGDLVLAGLAAQMKSWFRETDIIARMGGEEFTVLLVDTDLPRANWLAEQFVKHVSREPFPVVAAITISCGVSKLYGPEDGVAALKRADRALYRAKTSGRNRAVYADELETIN
jgi:diguanylate cyclase (GGDEF)-like protein